MKRAASGAVAFVLLHGALRLAWHWFSNDPQVWFVSEPKTMGVAAAVFAFVGGTAARRVANYDGAIWAAAQIAFGAFLMSAALLFLQPWGPGNLFPIVLVIGGSILFLGSLAGTVSIIFLRTINRPHP